LFAGQYKRTIAKPRRLLHNRRETIRILDNGQGIAAGALPHVFDLFMQEATDRRGGLGIGLNVVRGLVELHGGSVAARSDGIGKGSEFNVTPPAVAASVPTRRPGLAQPHDR
jgi:signal transduction histidine kinase